ncbi:MAG: YheC/YheD family protein [Gammaproteobacteria bacterium]|nr:YheC/YheD family protein [Gammaproteobacteria bacterium]
MKEIGFICDVTPGVNPIHTFGRAWFDRAIPMANFLEQNGAQLIIYSRLHVDPKTKRVQGYILENSQFITVETSVPTVNGSWFFGITNSHNKSKMNATEYYKWANEHDIEIYPSMEFLKFAADKLLCYETVTHINKTIQQYTEVYNKTASQLKRFFERHDAIFIKPQYGGHGEGICLLKKRNDRHSVEVYSDKGNTIKESESVGQLNTKVAQIIGEKPYIIQEAVDVEKFEGSAFDIRVITVNDGQHWKPSWKFRLSKKNSDVSNLGQGGEIKDVDEYMSKVFIDDVAESLKQKILDEAINISQTIDQVYDGEVMELAFDFVISKDKSIKLLELNACPDMVQPNMPISIRSNKGADATSKKRDNSYADIFDLSDNEVSSFNKYTASYSENLAKFLLSKVHCKVISRLA